MIPREELAAMRERSYCPDVVRLIAEVERLRGVAEAAIEYRRACFHLAAWGSDTARELVNEAKRKMIAALDAAEGGE